MRYQKTHLVPAGEINRLNALIDSATQIEGQELGAVLGSIGPIAFNNACKMTVDVVNHEAGPAITVTLLDMHDNRAGHEPMVPGHVDADFTCHFMDDLYRLTIERAARVTLDPDVMQRYIEDTGGAFCPYCESEDINRGPIRSRSEHAGQCMAIVSCLACEARWEERFQLYLILHAEPPGQNVAGPTGD